MDWGNHRGLRDDVNGSVTIVIAALQVQGDGEVVGASPVTWRSRVNESSWNWTIRK